MVCFWHDYGHGHVKPIAGVYTFSPSRFSDKLAFLELHGAWSDTRTCNQHPDVALTTVNHMIKPFWEGTTSQLCRHFPSSSNNCPETHETHEVPHGILLLDRICYRGEDGGRSTNCQGTPWGMYSSVCLRYSSTQGREVCRHLLKGSEAQARGVA